MNNFSPLLNSSCEVMTRVTTQLPSGQVSESWTVAISDVKCRKDMAPRAYSVKDDKYKSLEERYIFFVDSAYKTQITRSNRIQHEGVDYFIVDITNFDGFANLHHIEIYCIKVDLGGGAGMDFEAGEVYYSGQAITIGSITKTINWGGLFDQDISVESTIGSKISWLTSNSEGYLKSQFDFQTSEFGGILLSQEDLNNTTYAKLYTDLSDVFNPLYGIHVKDIQGFEQNVHFLSYGIKSTSYLNNRNDMSSTFPINFLYSDEQGNILSANFLEFMASSFFDGISAGAGAFSSLSSTNYFSTAQNSSNFVVYNTQLGGNVFPMFDLVETWNTSGRAVGIRMQLTDTQSDPLSHFLKFIKGGVDMFTVDKFGVVIAKGNMTSALNYANDGSVGVPAYSFVGNTTMGMSRSGSILQFSNGSGQLGLSIDANRRVYVPGRFNQTKGANVASTGNLTLGNDGNTFLITGTTTINTIVDTNWTTGAVITLIFSGASVVTHNGTGAGAKVFLAGSANYTPANNSVLTLVYDGTQWQEVCRKTP